MGLVVTAPLLPPGFVLAYDMVFVPKPRLSLALLGVSGAPPRSVPSALAVALLSRVLTGQVVEKLILFGIVAGMAYGAARLVPAHRPAARVAAGLMYAWTPLTYERLLAGHWALLLGAAALPWVAGAAVSLRMDRDGAAWRLALALFVAMLPSPYTGILGAAIAAAVVLCPPWEGFVRTRRRAGVLVALVVGANLPWLVPAALGPSVPERPLLAMALFRARSDSPLGTVGSLLSLGGLWRGEAAPPGRGTWIWIPAFVIVAGLALAGWRELGRRWPRGAGAGLLLAAAVGLVLAAAPTVPGLDALARWLAGLPGGGILRDSQKFVLPLALAVSVGFGLGVERVLDAATADGRRPAVASVALALLPVALAPTLAWGAGGRLFVSRYPASWTRVESIVAADPRSGGLMALPWHAFLPFGWNRDRVVHQPALQFFSRPVLASSSLQVGSFRLPEEDPWARLAAPAVQSRRTLLPELSRLGVRYVVLFKEADWRAEEPSLLGLAPLLDTPDLRLYRSPKPARVPSFPAPPVAAVAGGDVLALGLVAMALARIGPLRRRRASGRVLPPDILPEDRRGDET